ncbi:MAG TPA: aryl-sulfate sulfotransferase [Terriglobales bacterium]|nr:aryl-sulfate sulfotransferase [Terriglobales bacterium]
MSKAFYFGVVTLFVLSLTSGVALAAVKPANVSITLSPSLPSPQQLGASITWTATVNNAPPGHTYDYQFSAALQGSNQIVRDFDLPNSFTWVPWTVEGTYVVSVWVRDITSQPYQVFPRVLAKYVLLPWVTTPGGSIVNPTSHPLVALFSAGPCTIGHSIRVRFQQNSSQTSMTTNAVPCSNNSANFLVAGMLPSTLYQMHWEEFANNFENSGPDIPFTTGALPANFPGLYAKVLVPPSPHDAAFPLVLFQFLPPIGQPIAAWPLATDLSGNVMWYFPGELGITRTEAGGNYFSMEDYVVSEWDLVGNLVLQTNPEILNEQLAAHGYPQMTSFNAHETVRMPNGNIMLLGARDVVSTMYQGGTQQDPVDILGDMILVLDHNMQLLWAWDSFAHQDLSREATLDDICVHNTGAGCPAFSNQFTQANDWLHSNALQLTTDGNILISERDQDWVLKINYNNGQGDGRVLWKMGPYGDFTILNPPQNPCGDPKVYPWFTHQHDAAFALQINSLKTFTVFDDGNLRHKQCGMGNSRGMVLLVGEEARTVYIETQADLGQYSFALGSAQLLTSPPNNIDASFGNGFVNDPGHSAQAVEVDLTGKIVYSLEVNGYAYRSYRMQDLYTLPHP